MKNQQNFQKILFGIGSNLGDKNLNILNAIDKLQNYLFLKNIKISTIYKNPAMLPPLAPIEWNKEFYNIAISADIDLKIFDPLKILETIKKIEKDSLNSLQQNFYLNLIKSGLKKQLLN